MRKVCEIYDKHASSNLLKSSICLNLRPAFLDISMPRFALPLWYTFPTFFDIHSWSAVVCEMYEKNWLIFYYICETTAPCIILKFHYVKLNKDFFLYMKSEPNESRHLIFGLTMRLKVYLCVDVCACRCEGV